MTRTLIALVLGVLLGVGATLLLAPSSQPAPVLLPTGPSTGSVTSPSPTVVAPPPTPEAGRDFYRQLADADAAELAALIAQAAARSPSTDRELALAVLFKRYAELDAVRAVRLAREIRVGGAALGAAYGAWARRAPEQVLAALSTVESPTDAADVALALISALGDDANAVRRVAAVLAERDEERATLANGVLPQVVPFVSPAGPVGVAAPRSALALVAQRWADLDPRRALAVTREIDDEGVRRAFETAALRSLARVAPDEAFAHLASLDTSMLQLATAGGTLAELARADPERMLNALGGLPPDARRNVQVLALQQLAERDPLAAWRHIEGTALGAERQMLTQIVARSYGRRDATAALAWARQQRGEPMLVSAVIAGVAQSDPNRALDLALELGSPMERIQAVQMVAATSARDDAMAEAMAERLLAVDDPQLRDMVAPMIVSMWAMRAPDRAMQWLLANGQNTPPNAYTQIGQQLAARDPRSAVGYTAQVPEAAREQWLLGVAQGYAQSDPDGAIDWLRQFRGEEWYGRAATGLAMTLAQRDGAAAARVLEQLPADVVGMERDMAVRNVIGIWSSQDPASARQWTLRLPRGAQRDGALAVMLTTTAMQRSESLDAGLLNAFSSPQAQQTALLQVVQSAAFADSAKARAIADAHLDPPLRAQAERMIDAARNQRGGQMIDFGVTQGVAPALRVR